MNAALMLIPAACLAPDAQAQEAAHFTEIKVETPTAQCPFGKLSQFKIVFVESDGDLNSIDQYYVHQTGRDTNRELALFNSICLNNVASRMTGRFKIALDNLVAAHNLCISQAATMYRKKEFSVGIVYLESSNSTYVQMINLASTYQQYNNLSGSAPKLAEVTLKYLKFSKEFPTDSAEALGSMAEGGEAALQFVVKKSKSEVFDLIKENFNSHGGFIKPLIDYYLYTSVYESVIAGAEASRPCSSS